MPAVGSEAWIAAFADAVSSAPVPMPGAAVVVQHELTDTGAEWYVVVDDEGASVAAGRHPSPDVTFTQDAATAAAVNAGRESAQQAFIDGRLRVRGAVERLVDVAPILAALPAVVASEG